MHHSTAVLDVVLLGVIDQGVLVTGGLYSIVTFLKLQSHSIRLRITMRNWYEISVKMNRYDVLSAR